MHAQDNLPHGSAQNLYKRQILFQKSFVHKPMLVRQVCILFGRLAWRVKPWQLLGCFRCQVLFEPGQARRTENHLDFTLVQELPLKVAGSV